MNQNGYVDVSFWDPIEGTVVLNMREPKTLFFWEQLITWFLLHVRWGCTAYGFDIVDEYCANVLFARQNHLQHVRWNISVVPSFRSTRHILWTWENMPKRIQTNGVCLKTGYPKIQWSLIESSYFPWKTTILGYIPRFQARPGYHMSHLNIQELGHHGAIRAALPADLPPCGGAPGRNIWVKMEDR